MGGRWGNRHLGFHHARINRGARNPAQDDTVFQEGGITKLGPATEAAKARLPGDSDLRDTFVLLGDPAMDLNLTIVPWAHEVFLPATLRGP